MQGKSSRITVTIPREVDQALVDISGHLGITKSALVASLLSGSVSDLWEIVQAIPSVSNPSEIDLIRLRGRSAEVVQSRLTKLQNSVDDLLADVPSLACGKTADG